MSPRRFSILPGAVLLLGMLIGALGMRGYDLHLARRWFRQGAPERRSALIEWTLGRRLDLDESQAQRLHELVVSQEDDFAALVEEARPRREQLRQELLEGARDVLRPEQLRELEGLLRRDGRGAASSEAQAF